MVWVPCVRLPRTATCLPYTTRFRSPVSTSAPETATVVEPSSLRLRLLGEAEVVGRSLTGLTVIATVCSRLVSGASQAGGEVEEDGEWTGVGDSDLCVS